MELEVTGAFIYFTIPIFGGINITQTTISSLIVTALLCWAFVYFGKNLKKRPDGKQVLVEKGVMMLRNMVAESMGEHNIHWAPFIGTIFLSSIFGSFIGLTGFLRSTTADLSTTIVWAVMVTAISALIGAFASNPTVFHAKDGSGYDFIAEQTIAVDKINPQVAANLPVALGAWKKYDPERQEKMKAALEKIINTPNLSPNTYEIVSKSLGIEKKPEPVKARAFREAEGTKTFKSGAHAGNIEPNVLMKQALKAKGR